MQVQYRMRRSTESTKTDPPREIPRIMASFLLFLEAGGGGEFTKRAGRGEIGDLVGIT